MSELEDLKIIAKCDREHAEAVRAINQELILENRKMLRVLIYMQDTLNAVTAELNSILK
jgi:hypothetical protein